MSNDPRWFWEATFRRGGDTVTFYADTKAEALDHAKTLCRDFGKTEVVSVKRLKHAKDVTPDENAHAGRLRGYLSREDLNLSTEALRAMLESRAYNKGN